ncbi:MAG: NfeD family protein [Candidatus Parabeggiatoa sp. nov. 2]|nr:MAG: hypothetical protein B6247_03250 [Beggiatoa sp. 4572_84]RKZ64129.1 MAG: NfeD family protein [Gammaproteobacteria bacterium]
MDDLISYWHWWILAATLVMLEFLALGTFGSFFLWPAIAAAILGCFMLILEIGFDSQVTLPFQVLILAMISVVSVLIGRVYLGKHPLTNDEPFLNKRGSELEERICIVSEAIVNGIGRIRVDDSSWRVEGPDCPVGTQVKIIGSGGVRLQVEPLSQNTKSSVVSKIMGSQVKSPLKSSGSS